MTERELFAAHGLSYETNNQNHMTIPTAVQSVRNWMQLYQQETPTIPLIPAGKVRRLRHKLNLEEMRELNEATTPAEPTMAKRGFTSSRSTDAGR